MAKERSLQRGLGKKVLTLLIVIVGVGAIAASIFYFIRYRDVTKKLATLQSENSEQTKQLNAYKADPNQAAQAEADKIIAEVGKLYDLPKDEKPSVATVKDKSKLSDQPFFAKAENNDVTLIYSTAKLAILYRPTTKQIINVSSVTIQDQQAPPAPTP